MRKFYLKQMTGLGLAFALAADSPRPVTNEVNLTSANTGDVYIRVVDVGNALCVVIKTPDGHSMLYDAGDRYTEECFNAVKEIVGKDKLDLIVLSHSDTDHIGEIPDILPAYPPEQLIYTGRQGTALKDVWPAVVKALSIFEKNAKTQGKKLIRNLRDDPLPNTLKPQQAPLEIPLGSAKATFVAGWYNWPYGNEPKASLSLAEKNNVVSIVVKFTYAGKSVLLTGDTIGRKAGDDADACRYAEKWMAEQGNVPLKSDVLIGEHHGGDNSSAPCFIKAVQPDYVVFSAGRLQHKHPRASAAERYLNASPKISADHIFRTDRGDDQGALEWDYLRQPKCKDKAGDDDVEIVMYGDPNKDVRVQYRRKAQTCAPK